MKAFVIKTIRRLVIVTLILLFSCDKDEDPCFETVCYGPDNTDCYEEPKTGSAGCFAPGPDSL